MKVKVIVDNQPPLYPGTLLRGRLVCSVNSRTEIRSVKIRCYGKEYTEWRGSGKNAPTYIGKHYFFQMETKLFEPEDEHIQPGEHTYPFTFLLPPNLPSTFEFPYGYIRYSLKGIVDIPLAFDPEDRVDLAVISVLDITTLPENLRQPSQSRDEATMGCCWISTSEPVRMEAQINKRAFIVGETIKIDLEVNNMSDSNVDSLTFKLIRCLAAHSERPRHDVRYINEDLLEKKFSGVGAHGQQTYDVNLVIPNDLPVPNMVECQLLEAIYRIEVTGSTSGFSSDVNLVIAEVKIGHVDGPGWSQTATSSYPDQAAHSSGYLPPSSGYPYPLEDKTEVAKKRWQGLRDVFRKELRKFGPNKNEDEVPSGLSSIWVHFKDMYFLTDSLEPFKPQADISSLEMETSSPCTTVDCKEEFCFYDEPLGDEEPHQSEQVSQDPMEFRNVDSSSSQNLSRKRTFTDSNEYYMEKKERLESCGDRACTKEDSDRQFLISLLPFIKRFSLSKTLMLRQKLLQVLIDEEQNG